MPNIVFPKNAAKDARAKDPSLGGRVMAFLSKLNQADDTSGLHVEPIHGTADPRVRTARVDKFYRAVLFQIGQGADAVYVFHGVWPHDDAIEKAKAVTLKVNPRNGATEVTQVASTLLQGQAAVEAARRQARERIAAAEREAQELSAEALRREEANAQAAAAIGEPRAAGVTRETSAGSETSASGATVEREPTSAAPDSPDSPAASPEVDATPVVARDAAPQWAAGVTDEAVHTELGLDLELAAAALAAERESQVLDLAVTAEVAWHGDALLMLATGATIAEVREEFALSAPAEAAGDEDADILAGLHTPAARSMFTWVENDEDLRHAIENLDFGQWQLFLHPQQRTLVEKHTNGAMRISGGAGTGKTVVTVHRAAWLADEDRAAGRPVRILLTTYTRNLVDDLRRQLGQLDPGLPIATKVGEEGVMVNGLDSLASILLQKAGDAIADTAEAVLGRRRTRVLSNAREDLWRDTLASSGDELPEALRSTDFLASEYELVVLPGRITALREYLRVRRPGRGVALDRAKRAAVWKVIEAYRDRAAALEVTTYNERLALAAAWLDARAQAGEPRPFDHVLVDEAQDLTPAHLQLLRALAAEGPDDLFLAEDSHQRIYGKKIVLSHYGINVRGRSRRLTRNYRTTRQNLGLAFGILEGGEYEDLEGGAEEHHYLSPRSGPDPVLLPAPDRAAELDAAAALLRRWVEEDAGREDAGPETIAVLVRDKYQRDAVVTGLAERELEVRGVDREAVGRGRPVVMTMHRAKGLEFRKVLLFDVSMAAIPRSLRDQEYSEADRADAMLRERSLLYVAATRARDQLAISWSGEASPLLRGLVG